MLLPKTARAVLGSFKQCFKDKPVDSCTVQSPALP